MLGMFGHHFVSLKDKMLLSAYCLLFIFRVRQDHVWSNV